MNSFFKYLFNLNSRTPAMDDYESDGRDYSENIDEGPGNAETEVPFFFRQPPPEACPPKKQEPSKTTEQKSKSKRSCDCKPEKSHRSRRVRRKKLPRSVNPFIIFYLRMYFKNPKKPVTVVAREAGRVWCSLSDKEKADYIKKARKESAKRQRRRAKRMRRKC